MFDIDDLRKIPDNIKAVSLKDVVEQRSVLQFNKVAINFLHDGELTQQEPISYRNLDIAAKAILNELRHFCFKGDRVVLLFPPGNSFVLSFLACLYGGLVAVPMAFPGRRDRDWQRVFNIVSDCDAKVILSVGDNLKRVTDRFHNNYSQWKGTFIDIDSISISSKQQIITEDISGDDLAFLQYTSGSTGAPKGVMVSHANLLHNQRVLQTGFKNDRDTCYVSWLPLFHDMGLIGCALQSLYLGSSFNYMAPAAFLQRPLRWIHAISHYQATTSGAPNFAYDLCAARYNLDECKHLDLSHWKCAFNGAEPIRPNTLSNFHSIYAPHGLTITAQYPCYGLAEGVLMVSGATELAEPKLLDILGEYYLDGRIVPAFDQQDVKTIVGSGGVVGNQNIAIVDPISCKRAQADRIGEIWLSGPSVASGYWKKPDATIETFKATIQGESSEKAYLRTGDSGYMDPQGELYITSRLKDTIIINGRNYFPQDLELLVEMTDESLHVGGGAIFSVEHEGTEKIVVVQEVKRTHQKSIVPDALIKKIRQKIAQEFELNVFDVCLIKPGTLLKTTSGKVQRRANRDAYLDDALSIISQHRESVEKKVVTPKPSYSGNDIFLMIKDWSKEHFSATGEMTTNKISTTDLFIDTGLTSVDSIALIEHLSQQFNQRIDASLVWEFPEIGDFCKALTRQLSQGTPTELTTSLPTHTTITNVYAMDEQSFQSLLEKEMS